MRELLKRAFAPARRTVPPGLHHFTREVDGQVARYHLRVEPDGHGTLIANATSAAHLSPRAASLAYESLRGLPEHAGRRARPAFPDMSEAQLDEALAQMQGTIERLARGHGGYPLTSAGARRRRPLSAPLSADVVAGEISRTLEVLRRLFDAGVPHAVLIAGEVPQPKVLVRLVERAEDLGMICGVRARATDLATTTALDDVAMAGLDHLDLYLASAERHDAIFGDGDRARALALVDRCHALELCPTAVTPIIAGTLYAIDAIAAELAARRIPAWTLFAVVEEGEGGGQVLGAGALRQAAATAEELADHHDLNLVWAPPLERDSSLPVAEQARRGPRASSDASIRVEADGTVRSAVGHGGPAGNLLRDRWDDIWRAEAFRSLREGAPDADRCEACPELALCAGGCPAHPSTWSRS